METSSNGSPAGTGACGIRHRIVPGLALLLEAREFAGELERDLWDFAVEARSLRVAGLTTSDLRWLICKGYIKHARECTRLGRNGREFRPAGDLTFTKRSCFVLTEAGVSAANSALPVPPPSPLFAAPLVSLHGQTTDSETDEMQASACACTVDPRHEAAAGNGHAGSVWQRPKWDGLRHELRVGERLVKIFKLPSPNQEAILMAFEEEGWPPRIDDPLPPVYEIDPKRRLHDTIKSLNRRQRNRCLKFMGDGTGEGVRWEYIAPAQGDSDRGSARSDSESAVHLS